MMKVVYTFFAASLATLASAQTFELRRPTAPLAAEGEIEGGTKASPANWPATFIFDAVTGGPCTATAVGPRVLLTAAHCLPNAPSGKVRHTEITVWCEKAPLHNNGYDIALCASSDSIPIAKNMPYESVRTSDSPNLGDPLAMLGYGCTSVGGIDGVLFEGEAKFSDWLEGKRQFVSSGKPALCAGDSGGGAYSPSIKSSRKIVGVASNVYEGVSRFASISHPKIAKWIADWQARQVNPLTQKPVEVKICGINGANAFCRG